MKSIFFLTTHFGALQSFASAVRGMPIRIQVPGQSLRKHLHYGNFDVEPTALSSLGVDLSVIEEDEYFGLPPDMLICSHPFTQEVMYNHAVRMRAIKPVALCCYTQGFSVPHDFRYFDALIAVDYPSYVRGQKYGIPSIFYWPWVDFEFWAPPSIEPTDVCIRMFCNSLEQRPEPLPQIFNNLSQKLPAEKLQNYEWFPATEVRRLLHEASATLSIKPNEGYGYSVIESLACGRPVFVYKPLIDYQTYINWLIEDQTCIFFDSEDEFMEKLKEYSNNSAWRDSLRKTSADAIRDIIDNNQQNLQMQRFLQSVLYEKSYFSPYIPDNDIFRTKFSNKRELWNVLSNKMWWDPIAALKEYLDYNSEYGLLFDLNKARVVINEDGSAIRSTEEFRLVRGTYEVGILKQDYKPVALSVSLKLTMGLNDSKILLLESRIDKHTKSWVGFIAEIESDDDPIKLEAKIAGVDVLPWVFIRPILTKNSV